MFSIALGSALMMSLSRRCRVGSGRVLVRRQRLRRTRRGTVLSTARPLRFLGTDTPGSIRMESSSSVSRPLRLSDSQMALVRRAAALLAPSLRGKFLQSIAHELADADPIDDEASGRWTRLWMPLHGGDGASSTLGIASAWSCHQLWDAIR